MYHHFRAALRGLLSITKATMTSSKQGSYSTPPQYSTSKTQSDGWFQVFWVKFVIRRRNNNRTSSLCRLFNCINVFSGRYHSTPPHSKQKSLTFFCIQTLRWSTVGSSTSKIRFINMSYWQTQYISIEWYVLTYYWNKKNLKVEIRHVRWSTVCQYSRTWTLT
jgi:hypothetical protein